MSNIKEFLAVTTVEDKIDGLDTKLTSKLDSTSQDLKTSMGNLETSVGAKLDSQKTSIDASLGAQATLINNVGKQIVIGTPNSLTHSVKFTSSSNWVAPFSGTVYVTACGAGGGGAGGLRGSNSNNRGGGAGGAGGNTVYRVPLQVTQGDTVRVIVGAGGSGGAQSTSKQQTGGPGSATKVENVTALTTKPALEFTAVTHVIEAQGGGGGRTSSSRVSAATAPAPTSFIVELQQVGSLIRGGGGGLGQLKVNGRQVSTIAGGTAAGRDITRAWAGYPRISTRTDAGGAGGSVFSLEGYGTGGQGGTSTPDSTGGGQKGLPGVVYIEYN